MSKSFYTVGHIRGIAFTGVHVTRQMAACWYWSSKRCRNKKPCYCFGLSIAVIPCSLYRRCCKQSPTTCRVSVKQWKVGVVRCRFSSLWWASAHMPHGWEQPAWVWIWPVTCAFPALAPLLSCHSSLYPFKESCKKAKKYLKKRSGKSANWTM